MKRRNKTWRMAILIGNLLLPERWEQNDKISAKRLRRRLKLTEHFVKRIAGDDELRRLDYLTEFQSTMLDELMQVRASLLNRLFLLGCSDAEVEGFKRVNDNLHRLHLEMSTGQGNFGEESYPTQSRRNSMMTSTLRGR